MDDSLKIALAAVDAIQSVGARSFIGGSLASSVHGIPRATLDADIIADLQPSHVKPLIAALGAAWYSDEQAILEAIKHRSSFNLIHFETAMKVDIFIPKRRRFDAGQFLRAARTPIAEGSAIEASVCSAEDIIAAKLEWFRLGNETSERQWSDIIGVLKINKEKLNFALLKASAEELGVVDLLTKAVNAAGILPNMK